MKEFKCFLCPRIQSYAPKGVSGGIDESEALQIGWSKVENEWKWLCPFCAGNEDKLRQVFNN